MEVHISQEKITYDGSQLSSHFALKRFGVKGDNLVAFTGPMDIAPERIADLEDLLQNQAIRSPNMLHFIVEFFGAALETVILRQRILVRLAADLLRGETGADLRVQGDDLYQRDRKLSVSIAAPSPVSGLIHLGLNIETKGVPVKAVGLNDLGMDPFALADRLGRAFQKEIDSIAWASSKVKGVP